MQTLGSCIKRAREFAGLTLREVGAYVRPSVAATTVMRWETGEIIPSRDQLRGFGKLLRLREGKLRKALSVFETVFPEKNRGNTNPNQVSHD